MFIRETAEKANPRIMPTHVRGINALLCKRCYFEAKPPYGTQSIRHLNFLLSSRSSAYVESNHGYIVTASLALCLFARRLIFFALVLALFAPPLCSSSFTALCAYSYAPSDAIITVSPFSSCPRMRKTSRREVFRQAEPPFLFRAACRFDGESRTVPLLPYKDRLAGIQIYFTISSVARDSSRDFKRSEEFTSLKAL